MQENDRKSAGEPGADKESKPSGRGDRDVGHALRSVYTATVAEEIPADILALLGKLD